MLYEIQRYVFRNNTGRCISIFINDSFRYVCNMWKPALYSGCGSFLACNKVFRKNFLKENVIGLIPPGGYRMNEKQSLTAIQWIKWLAHKVCMPVDRQSVCKFAFCIRSQDGLDIRHARNGKEVKIQGFKVDGYAASINTVFEFHGCEFHGHPSCRPKRDKKVFNSGLTYEEAYQIRTRFRRKFASNLRAITCSKYRYIVTQLTKKDFF